MNQNEFISIINPFKDKVFRLAKRLLVSYEEAQDASQEVLYKLWKQNNKLANVANIEALAMTMTKNHCLDQLKSKRASNLSLESNFDTQKETSLSKQTEDKNSLEIVNKLINSLPEQQKIILQLRDIEDCDFETIAKILDMNEATIRVNLSRARKTIRENMNKIHNYGIN